MIKNQLTRLRRGAGVHVVPKIGAEQMLKSGITGHAPAVGAALFVQHVFKIGGGDVALHLQAGDDGVKAFFAVLAKIAQLF